MREKVLCHSKSGTERKREKRTSVYVGEYLRALDDGSLESQLWKDAVKSGAATPI